MVNCPNIHMGKVMKSFGFSDALNPSSLNFQHVCVECICAVLSEKARDC